MVTGLAERVFHLAYGAAIVLVEVIPVGGLVDVLPAAIAARVELAEDSLHEAFANTVLAHGEEILLPQMFVLGAGREVLDIDSIA